MKQIYYTQCPIGYGLGASNGFQIKRVSPDYPISGDFRYLGLRAFLAGTRVMAPPALRYRRNERGDSEVAWLTPRSHEYETERGLWGRPGGHFAHGVLLDEKELNALASWPAGLFDRPCWTRSDRVPSRGEPPALLELGPADLRMAPDFAAFEHLVRDEDAQQLGVLLTSLAMVVREGRTLFLLDQPERLADRVALLTLALPAPWRRALTFSTYHDRPEELPGFRIQGTVPAARPNRAAMLAGGVVADFGSGTIAPRVEPASWAATLATWLTRRSDADRLAWEQTLRRGETACSGGADDSAWSDEWLDQLIGFENQRTPEASRPITPEEWSSLLRLTRWAHQHSLTDELVKARPPGWWLASADDSSEGRRALLGHLGMAGAWSLDEAPAAWGGTVAVWLRNTSAEDRTRILDHGLRLAPATARPGFVRALIGSLPDPEAQAALDWLATFPASDRTLLLALGIRGAVSETLERRDPRRLRSLIEQAFALPEALPAVLEALAAEAATQPAAVPELARWLTRGFESAGSRPREIVLRWALKLGGDARLWLRDILRQRFAEPTGREAWRSLQRLIPPPLQHRFAWVVLELAREPTLPDEAFRWGVEEVLLPLPDSERPHDRGWPGTYLDRTPSGLSLVKRLTSKEYRGIGLPSWLERAQARGELTECQQQRIVDCLQYARAMRTGDPRALQEIRLPVVPAVERGAILGQMLRHVAGGGREALGLILDSCRQEWPHGFEAGQPGLSGLAQALADSTLEEDTDPASWFDRLHALLDRLGLTDEGARGFEADSLAAEISAQVMRRSPPPFDVWTGREFLLRHDRAWRLLAVDARQDLVGRSLTDRLERLNLWDHRLCKGINSKRFFEVWLNVCDGPTLAIAVAAHAAALRTLGPISWWQATHDPDVRDDIRDAFATLSPMAPLAENHLTDVQNWMRPPQPRSEESNGESHWPTRFSSPETPDAIGVASFLSRRGAARWRCLEALSMLGRPGLDSNACWQIQADWKNHLPLAKLDAADRYRFLGGFIRRIDAFESYQIARLAKWIFECGVSDYERLSHWAEELEELDPVPHEIRLARSALVGELRVELRNVMRDAREPVKKSQSPDSPHGP